MKKRIILTVLIGMLSMASAIAQENTVYTPKSGDFSIGFDINPVVNFVGNIFNNTSDQTLDKIGGEPVSIIGTTTITQPTVSIVGRYMLSNDLAVRTNVGIMINQNTTNTYVQDDAAVAIDPLATTKVIDSERIYECGGSITVALEKRIGRDRLQGVFSGGLVYAFATSSTKYSYGNAVTDINQTPTTTNNSYTAISSSMPNARVTKSCIDGSHSFGFATSAGIEYFIAPKISIGAEVNLIAVWGVTTGQTEEYEGYNTFTNSVVSYTELSSPSSSSFTLGTENIGGNLGIHFYF